MSLKVTILKTLFSNNPVIFFCLDTMYWVDYTSEFLLINISNLFINKLISNKTAILTYSWYFLDFLWLCSTRARKAKVTKDDLAVGFIRVISIGYVSVWSVFGEPITAESIFARGTYIDIGLSGMSF